MQVQDSIIRISALLDKIADPVKINKGYDFRDDDLFINNIPINTKKVDTVNALSKLSRNEKKQFLNLTNFLRSNKITSGSYDTYLGLWTFEYEYLPDGDNDDARVISILDGADKNRIISKVKVLDHRRKVYLLKYK